MAEEMSKILFELEMKLLQPDIRCSAEEISELLDADFIEFCRSGRIWQYHIGDVIDSQRDSIMRYEIIDFKIKEISDDVFLATYQSKRPDESDQGTSSLRSSIWKNVDGKWKMVFHQGTPTK